MWTIFKESKMKKLLCLSVGTVALLLGCSVQKEEDPVFGGYETYYASFEDSFTKTVAGDDGSVLWMKNDQITIFEKSTVGHAFKFTGRNGAHSGGFSMVEGSDYGAGEPMECYYAVYPHSDDNTLETTGELILTFPSEQSYEADSFGPGANLSVAKSDNNHFSFKNIGGYLTFSLYGDDVTVSSITLKGNNGEKIAGDMSVFMEEGSDPASSFLSGKYYDTYTEITLTCDPGVKLGATSDEGTAFWFVVPPISFENGLTFIVRDTQGNTFTKSSTKARTIARSERTGFNPIQVSFSVPVSSVSLNKSETTLTVGATEALVATVAPANATDKTVSWSSSNTSVATVSDGTVTAKGVGTTTITATAGGKSATCTVTVTPILVSSITLSSSTASVNVGSTVTLTATATPTNAADKTVSWSSSNTGVATVSSTGVVTGVASGTATITATANDDIIIAKLLRQRQRLFDTMHDISPRHFIALLPGHNHGCPVRQHTADGFVGLPAHNQDPANRQVLENLLFPGDMPRHLAIFANHTVLCHCNDMGYCHDWFSFIAERLIFRRFNVPPSNSLEASFCWTSRNSFSASSCFPLTQSTSPRCTAISLS